VRETDQKILEVCSGSTKTRGWDRRKSDRANEPLRNAFVVRKLREAGALVLAKANLTELARGGATGSSPGGQTRNPYDLTRTPGGSGGGTGAAIAASFGVIGTGSDTGQSVRSPASALSLVGLRPTRGLISRSGIIPVSTTHDEAGPITRTVADAARMLDIMAGYDPDDPITASSAHRRLDRVLRTGGRPSGSECRHRGSHQENGRRGRNHHPHCHPDLNRLTRNIQDANYEAKIAFNNYLAARASRSGKDLR
jgi:hypothetical protein